jgi:hypothetical protein
MTSVAKLRASFCSWVEADWCILTVPICLLERGDENQQAGASSLMTLGHFGAVVGFGSVSWHTSHFVMLVFESSLGPQDYK